MIAVCPSAPPRLVAKPAMRSGSISAVSAGVISSAMTMLPSGRVAKAWNLRSDKLRISREPTSRMSWMRPAR